ncbi:hypothetical protein FBU59_003175 [Linderina macrospora]|uniref:Uncharacterized protein n=1 Tax=Linderina macrospora TaxID=4868 RepID=A0ACC1J905_9FUNG|nr:hypothetical protein FBU59_003175 [Linderina macrospora]
MGAETTSSSAHSAESSKSSAVESPNASPSPASESSSSLVHDSSSDPSQSRTAGSIATLAADQPADVSPSPSAESESESAPVASASAEPEDLQAKTIHAECMAAGVENWDRNLQIAGVFIILGVSALGCLFPIACQYVRWLRVSPIVLTTGKFFGAGVILSTAFIHMLGGATESLKDDCLEGRLGDFDAWPQFLAMVSILAMHLIEHLLTTQIHTSCTTQKSVGIGNKPAARKIVHEVRMSTSGSQESSDRAKASEENDVEKQFEIENLANSHVHAHGLLVDPEQRRKHLSTYILELGIALHSVIIGMTLAVTGGGEFKTLLAAISFHQFFEGLALGTRISALTFERHAVMFALLNACGFALTTPLGQALGIGIRESFAPRSPTTLLTMGVLDGLSAGILMYSAIVNLLVEEFGSSFRAHSKKSRVLYFAAMYMGCAAMSIIGKWA